MRPRKLGCFCHIFYNVCIACVLFLIVKKCNAATAHVRIRALALQNWPTRCRGDPQIAEKSADCFRYFYDPFRGSIDTHR